MQSIEFGLGQPRPDEYSFESVAPEESAVTPEGKEKPLYFEYIAGPFHVHTRESEEGEGATHLISELSSYLQNKIDAGTDFVELAVISDHSEHLSWTKSDQWFYSHGYSAEEIKQIREATVALTDKGVQQVELPVVTQNLLMRTESTVIDEQVNEINSINAQKGQQVKIFSGTETSIMKKDGSMTLPDSTLSKLDVVTASIHPDFVMDEHGQKERIYENTPEGLVSFYLKALENPNIDVLGHPIKANMIEIISSLQQIIETEGGLDRILGPLMAKMADKRVAFEINMKDPLLGLKIGKFSKTSESKPASIFEEVVRLAKKYGTPLAIGVDFHVLKDWQYNQRIIESLSDQERHIIEQSETAPERQAGEDIRRRFGPGVKFWLRLARICKTLKKFDVSPDQVINSSRENMEKWLKTKKNNPAEVL